MKLLRVRGLTVAILGNELDLARVVLALRSNEPLLVVKPLVVHCTPEPDLTVLPAHRNHQLLPTLLVAAPEADLEVESETDLLQRTLAQFKINRNIDEPVVFLEKDKERIVGYSPTPTRRKPPKNHPKHFQQMHGMPRKSIFRRR